MASFEWIPVDCQRQFEYVMTFLCEKPIILKKTLYEGRIPGKRCHLGWTLLDQSCFKIIHYRRRINIKSSTGIHTTTYIANNFELKTVD